MRAQARLVLAAAALTLSSFCAPAAAFVHWPRGAGCHEDREPTTAPTKPAAPSDVLLPLPHKRPPRLEPASLLVIDAAVADALPTRRVSRPRIVEPAPPRWTMQSRSDWRCIGVPRGAAGILRVVGAPPGTRFYGFSWSESWKRENVRAAGGLNLRAALPTLRRELGRPLPADLEPHDVWEQLALKRDVARALADLDDRSAAPEVVALLRLLETQNMNLWQESLDSLRRLDRSLSERYASEVLARELAAPSDRSSVLLRHLLGWIETPTPALRALLASLWERFAGGGSRCELIAARIAHGDQALAAELRPHIAVDIRHQDAANCYGELVRVLAPGRDPAELDILTHRARWRQILDLLAHMQERERAGASEPSHTAARAELRLWLAERQKTPTISAGPGDRRYVASYRALFLVAAAHLGLAGTERELVDFVADPEADGVAPWIAAQQALRLDLPGAAELAERRLVWGTAKSTDRHVSEPWPTRGHLRITEAGEVVESLAARGDPRFALGLLQRDAFTRELATYLLARQPDRRVCAVVAGAARGARLEAIQTAFWALSILGDGCRTEMLALAADRLQPPEVRGMAIEALAMMRDPSVPRRTKSSEQDLLFQAALQRAGLIHRSVE